LVIPKKRFSAEQIVTLHRLDGSRQFHPECLPGGGHIAAELRDDLPNGEIFYSLKEALS
jgi:hypothetical protein